MVNELKRKFIKTTMLVVTILLVVFLASVNLLNITLARRDAQASLNQIAARDLRSVPGAIAEDGIAPEPARVPDEGNLSFEERKGRGEDLGKYFIVRISQSGAVIFCDLTHDADMDYEGMIALVNEADVPFAAKATGETETEGKNGSAGFGRILDPERQPDPIEKRDPDEKGEQLPDAEGNTPREANGRVSGHLFHAIQQKDGSVSYAFLDIRQDNASALRILLITAALGAVLWILILLVVIFLAKKAIAPIAANIEKQRQFITNAGHEIKTPLAVIVSNVDVQELHGGKTKWLDNIRTQALRLSDLTKQMLTLAKMEESGTAAFTSVTFDASQALEETVRVFRESALLRGIQIQTKIDPDVSICYPREQYQQMVELLMDNAVKYGKENGILSVTLHEERKTVSLFFRNDCEALPEIDPDQLFDRFYRSDSSRSRQTGGSGIGLAVVRAIASQGGGSAHAHFLPDQVIEFRIVIPKKL
ncbi:MAG TPA: hypothetical protein DHV42_04370 [Lachnospiraceae bacterium]|nr:hypothetical protein [Lachnospiraceae bacterium]